MTSAPSIADHHAADHHAAEPQDSQVDVSFRLDGRVALITGAVSGIGRAIAQVFAERGARVVIADLDAAASDAGARSLGGGAIGVRCDVTDAGSVQAAVDQVLTTVERIDVLVNCAGIAALAPAEELTAQAWDRTMAVNLTGTFTVCQIVGRAMLEAGTGTIVNLASQAGTVALHEHAAYCASKAGVLALTRVLASEWGGRGITVNAISPTIVLTDLGRKAWDNAKGDAVKAQIPTGRFALPREIAGAAVFLASGAARMVNGADLVVDGGYTIR